MNFLPSTTIFLGAIFLLICPALAGAQGVETDPTGVEDFAPELAKSAKKPAAGWLGVMLEAPDEQSGVEVVRVLRGSPAKQGGLEEGDRITKVDEQAVSSAKDVQAIVGKQAAGHKARVEFRRGDKTHTLTVALGEAPGVEQVLRQQFVGQPAPPFSASVVGEQASVDLGELKGKPVVIDFWATWCGPCRPMSKKLAKLHDRLGQRAHFVGLTSETQQAVERHLEKNPHGFTVATTQEAVMQTYLIESYPTVFVVDATGQVVGVFVGLGHGEAIAKLVDELVGAEPVDVDSVKPESDPDSSKPAPPDDASPDEE